MPRLSVEAVRELAEPLDADGDAIHRLTQGNAFFVTEVLAAGGRELPETVRDAVLARVAPLDERARRLIEAIAVVPRRAELWLLEAIVPEELEHLDALLDAGRHPGRSRRRRVPARAARLAIESSLAPHRRRSLHEALLGALADRGDLSRLAHHAEEAGDAEAVLRYAPEAGAAAAAVSSHREAARSTHGRSDSRTAWIPRSAPASSTATPRRRW